MKINGKEIKFLRTVKATADIAKLCPNEDIEKIGELFDKGLATTLETGAKIIHFLNEGYEMNEYFVSGRTHKPEIISEDEIMYLDDTTYTELMNEAMAYMNAGAETSIEVEESKKKDE